MFPVFLTKIKTRDGVILEGVCVEPRKKSGIALVWVHGLGSRFSSGQKRTEEISAACGKNRIGYFKFNTRGHDAANKDGPEQKRLQGSGFEIFEECAEDIRTMIRFVRRLGYGKIILAGHSTGANKILYYAYKIRDRNVQAIALLGGVSDRAARLKEVGAEKLAKEISHAKKIYAKDRTALMPLSYGIISARRFLSLHESGTLEDVFPSDNPKASWKELRSIRIPIAVIFGARDEYMDRPAKEILALFQKNARSTKSFFGGIIPNADHGFHTKEKEFAKELTKWIRSLDL